MSSGVDIDEALLDAHVALEARELVAVAANAPLSGRAVVDLQEGEQVALALDAHAVAAARLAEIENA